MKQAGGQEAQAGGHGIRDRQEDALFRILRLLEDDPTLSQRQLADAVGISLGCLNYTLKALLDRGLIRLQNFRKSDRKIAYAYLLTPQGAAEKAMLAARFLRRKLDEYERLRVEIESMRRDVPAPGENLVGDKVR